MEDNQEQRPHPCCNEPANLERFPQLPQHYMEQCRVCGCRHFVMEVEAGALGLEGKGIG